MREHIEEALRALPLGEAEIASVAARLLGSPPLLQENSHLRFESTTFLDFRSKVNAIVEEFSADGLTLENYLRAAVKHPSVFYQAPATVHANIEGVVRYFRKDGLTQKDYVQAVVKQPSLFRMPSATVQANIAGVVERFRKHGLTFRDYVRAAVKQPSLFCMSPATVQANLEGVVEHFGKDGLTLGDYLSAAVKQPALFSMAPATIIRHVTAIAGLRRLGLVHFRGQEDAPPEQLLKPLFDFLVTNPRCFCYSDQNIALRAKFSRLTGTYPRGATLLTWSRSRVEKELEIARGTSIPLSHEVGKGWHEDG